jgi:acyl transferase domain-containing protein
MECRFPGVDNVEAFWRLLKNGVNSITEVPSCRWDLHALYDPNPRVPGTMNTRWGGFLERPEEFDADFFGISAVEAERMDPQQRLVLEVAWEALENAGIAPDKLAGSQTGVFIGISHSDYDRHIYRDQSRVNVFHGTGTYHAIAANRVSYCLNLHGPSMAIDTACSSSLVAVHVACQSLRLRESDVAICGGVNLNLLPDETIALCRARALAPDGQCKTFDARANGYVRSEGCGIVILKRFADAVSDQDSVHAVIRGSAVNQNGMSNGLTAPNGLAQQIVIRRALQQAGVSARDINYVEAHGSGTRLGDPIEINALKAVLLEGRAPDRLCWIGSVKTNIGHLEAAAGVAGLIKSVLALRHREIPAHLNLKELNPHISLKNTPIRIPSKCEPWIAQTNRRLCGVSAFGFGGTNCHVVLEEAASETPTTNESYRPLHLLTLSAKNQQALSKLTNRYAAFVTASDGIALSDICFTSNTGRSHLPFRLAILAGSKEQLGSALKSLSDAWHEGVTTSRTNARARPKIAFLFSGGDSRIPSTAILQLYDTLPVFRQAFDRCSSALHSYLKAPLRDVVYRNAGMVEHTTDIVSTQLVIFALEYALAELWKSWGIRPHAVAGYFVGEYVAACFAGVFSLEQALELLVNQARSFRSVRAETVVTIISAGERRLALALDEWKSSRS